MDFVANKEQVYEMLASIGVTHIEELFQAIPEDLLRKKILNDDGLSEFEVKQLAETIAAKNSFQDFDSYLGAGAYDHHVPALVGAICGKSEFLTSYTPYQAEASQGTLQAMFEFQSAIAALTEMEIANSSLYDGASACAEALLMAIRIHKERNTHRILIAGSLHPYYRHVVDQYLQGHIDAIEVVETIPFSSDGTLNRSAFLAALQDNTTAVLIQSPNFFGTIEQSAWICDQTHAHGGLAILCGNPLSYALYATPGELGADIAVGDCQPLGHSLNYGGPYVGYMACKKDYMRQLPGRLAGKTVDSKGCAGYVLTLQTREQHIRREKATSNICTSQNLSALASLVTILWYGKEGIGELALTNYQRAAYLKDNLARLPHFSSVSSQPNFNEFVIKVENREMHHLFQHFRNEHIEPGIDLGTFFPDLQHHLLIAVTETKSKEQLDRYIAVAATL